MLVEVQFGLHLVPYEASTAVLEMPFHGWGGSRRLYLQSKYMHAKRTQRRPRAIANCPWPEAGTGGTAGGSMTCSSAVIKDDSSEARKATSLETSSGSAIRANGIIAVAPAPSSSVAATIV